MFIYNKHMYYFQVASKLKIWTWNKQGKEGCMKTNKPCQHICRFVFKHSFYLFLVNKAYNVNQKQPFYYKDAQLYQKLTHFPYKKWKSILWMAPIFAKLSVHQ